MLIKALLVIAKKRKQHKYPTDEWINYILLYPYNGTFSAIKKIKY